jgi:hypothetical protein
MSKVNNELFINKKHCRSLVQRAGKRWSKEAEDALNYAVMGIVLKAIRLSHGFKTVRRGEVLHALASAGAEKS